VHGYASDGSSYWQPAKKDIVANMHSPYHVCVALVIFARYLPNLGVERASSYTSTTSVGFKKDVGKSLSMTPST